MQSLPRLRLLATGGTIAGAQTGGDSRGYRAATLSIEALIAAVPQLAALAVIEVEQVAAIGSQDMDDTTWVALATRSQSPRIPAPAGVGCSWSPTTRSILPARSRRPTRLRLARSTAATGDWPVS